MTLTPNPKPKSRRDDLIIAQGQRGTSATLGKNAQKAKAPLPIRWGEGQRERGCVPALLMRIKRYPRWLSQRSNTNFIVVPNPFSKGMVWYGNPRKVLSDDVVEHQEAASQP